MNSGLISYRYASALLQFAEKEGTLDEVYATAKIFSKTFAGLQKLRAVLSNPFISKKEKRQLILLASGKKPSKAFERFIDLILSNERENNIQWILLKFIDLYREKKDIHFAKLTTAFELDKKTEKRIMEMVQETVRGTIEIENHIDKNILGGYIFDIDFYRWDASLSHQLAGIRKEYIDKNSKIV